MTITTKIFYLVATAKALWTSLRTPYRELELNRKLGGPATSEESKKSGAGGCTPKEMQNLWAYYDKMLFMRPYIYTKE